MSVSLRSAGADDSAYLLSSIRESLLKNSAYCARLHPATMSALLEPILATWPTTVAVSADDPATILGFIVYRDKYTVAFVYVRSQFRRQGIGKALLKHAGLDLDNSWRELTEIVCPFIVTAPLGGQNFPRLAESKGFKLRYRPYIGLEILAQTHYAKDPG